MTHRERRLAPAAVLATTLLLPLLAHAGGAMDLQQSVPPQPLPSDPAALPAAPAASASAPTPTDNQPSTVLKGVVIDGNRAVSGTALQAQLGDIAGRRFSLPQMNALAQRVADAYRELGYPFVRAYLPPQRIIDGVLHIDVIEGAIGQAKAIGPDPKAAGAQPFVDHGLPAGAVIRDRALERTMLLLDDEPGFRVHPVLRPGEQRGESDLTVDVERRNHVSGTLGYDNTGNAGTGANRARAALNVNSPFRFGDRLALSAMATDKDLWLGSADYEAPLGAAGLRAGAGYSRTSYQLGGDFEALAASGTADTAAARLSWPLLRSQKANAVATLTLQHKALQDRYDEVGLVRDKHSRSAVLALQFDRKDAWLGGGVSYGQLGLTSGLLSLDAGSQAADAQTARNEGGFSKLNLDVARIQKLPGVWSVYGRLSSQWASKNLDASEKYGIGGFLGVRAYPMGEGTGDDGWVSQFELRYDAGQAVTLFGLADAGRMRANAEPWDAASGARRSLAGAGVGARWLSGPWSLEATLASRVRGGPQQAEPGDRNPRLFVSLDYRFER